MAPTKHAVATIAKNAIGAQISSQTKSGAQVEYKYGKVDQSFGDFANVFLDGDESISSEDFRIPAGLIVNTSSYVQVAIDYAKGDKWITQVIPTTTFATIGFDFDKGEVLTGDGSTPPDSPLGGGGGINPNNTYTTINTLSTFDGMWARIAYGSINEKYGSIAASVWLNGSGATGIEWIRGLIRFRLRQAADYGSDPIGMLELSISGDVDPSDFKIIVTSKSGPTTFDLYARIVGENQWIEYTPIWSTVDRADLTWTPCEDMVATGSLPAGTQFIAEGGTGTGDSFSGVRIERNTDQTITTGTDTAILFPTSSLTTSYDTDAFHSGATNTSRLTSPVDGYYMVGGNVRFDTGSTGVRSLWIKKTLSDNTTTNNLGYTRIQSNTVATTTDYLVTAAAVYLPAGAYVELFVRHGQGSNLAILAESGTSAVFWLSAMGGGIGPRGPQGSTGLTGAVGPGVPVGGSTGQSLIKASGTNFDTTWTTITGGGGGSISKSFAFFMG